MKLSLVNLIGSHPSESGLPTTTTTYNNQIPDLWKCAWTGFPNTQMAISVESYMIQWFKVDSYVKVGFMSMKRNCKRSDNKTTYTQSKLASQRLKSRRITQEEVEFFSIFFFVVYFCSIIKCSAFFCSNRFSTFLFFTLFLCFLQVIFPIWCFWLQRQSWRWISTKIQVNHSVNLFLKKI